MPVPDLTFLRLEKNGAVIVDVHVAPNASKTQAEGLHDGALRVRLNAAPVDGKANQALVIWLAGVLGVSRASVEVVRGQTSRRKQLRVSPSVVESANWRALIPEFPSR